MCVCMVEDVCAVAWQQRNKVSMMSDKGIMGTPVVEHDKQRWQTVNGKDLLPTFLVSTKTK